MAPSETPPAVSQPNVGHHESRYSMRGAVSRPSSVNASASPSEISRGRRHRHHPRGAVRASGDAQATSRCPRASRPRRSARVRRRPTRLLAGDVGAAAARRRWSGEARREAVEEQRDDQADRAGTRVNTPRSYAENGSTTQCRCHGRRRHGSDANPPRHARNSVTRQNFLFLKVHRQRPGRPFGRPATAPGARKPPKNPRYAGNSRLNPANHSCSRSVSAADADGGRACWAFDRQNQGVGLAFVRLRGYGRRCWLVL